MPYKFTTEADALAHIATLENQITALTGERDTANSSVTTLTAQLAQVNERANSQSNLLTAANGKVTALEADKAALSAENATLKTKDHDFNNRLAAELAKHGIRDKAADTNAGQQGGADKDKKLTATERVLMAKGVSSLEELEKLGAKK